MARADFSERHYELAINIELVRESNEYFVPSQNEEAKLGYDIALVPALPRVWSSLTEGLPGVGEAAKPSVPRASSLFLQYKRPQFLSNRNGKEASARERAFGDHRPYYRFELGREQLKVLLDLQAGFAGRAAVCYAAGRFHKQSTFYAHKLRSEITENSAFLRLDDVSARLAAGGLDPANPANDHRWTYDEDGGRGLLCSEPQPVEGFRFGGLKETLGEWTASAEPLEQHVATLTTGLRSWRRESVEPVREQLQARADYELADLAYDARKVDHRTPAMEVQQTLDALGVGWFLAVPAKRRPSQSRGN
jgi:hypothetical protein